MRQNGGQLLNGASYEDADATIGFPDTENVEGSQFGDARIFPKALARTVPELQNACGR